MSILLELPSELETELSTEATRFGLSLQDYVLSLLAATRGKPQVKTGADLVAFWKVEGLIGTRREIADSQLHARSIRDQAEI